MKTKRQYDQEFKRMAVELVDAKSSLKVTAIPDSEQELDDPYIHTVSTEEFVETVERASQEKEEKALAPNGDDHKAD